MSNSSTRKKTIRATLIMILPLAVIIAIALFIFSDRLTTFCIERTTGYSLSYDKWQGSVFDSVKIEGMDLKVQDKGFSILADNMKMDIEELNVLGSRKINLTCDMKGVTFLLKEEDKSSGNMMYMLSGSNNKYEKVRFKLFFNNDKFKITEFEAQSENIKVSGDYDLNKEKDEISVDIKISISSEMAEKLGDDVRNNVLTLEDDGWYSTIINYNGNPVFLKALYSLTST